MKDSPVPLQPRVSAGLLLTAVLLVYPVSSSAAEGGAAAELRGRVAPGEERHRLLVTGKSSRFVLRSRRREGEAARITTAGEGSWFVFGTLRETGLPALLTDPLSLSFRSGRRTAASGVEADIAPEPSRRYGAALRAPGTAGLYILTTRDDLRWGLWGRAAVGGRVAAEAALQMQAPPREDPQELWGDSAAVPAGLRPLRCGLRLIGEEGPLRVRTGLFLSLSSVLPAGWAGCTAVRLRGEQGALTAGVGAAGGAYPDSRARLSGRRFRGEARGQWNPLRWLELLLEGKVRLEVPGGNGTGEVLMEEEGRVSAGVGGESKRLEICCGGSRSRRPDEPPERERFLEAVVRGSAGGGQWKTGCELWEGGTERGDEWRCAVKLRGERWQGELEGALSRQEGASPELSGKLRVEYGPEERNYRLWLQAAWSGALQTRGGALSAGEGLQLSAGYTARGILRE
jgi:hypothetical protein